MSHVLRAITLFIPKKRITFYTRILVFRQQFAIGKQQVLVLQSNTRLLTVHSRPTGMLLGWKIICLKSLGFKFLKKSLET